MRYMRLRYETGIATLVQFIVGAVLSFVNGGASIIGSCVRSTTADCVSNALVSLILIIMTALAFGALWGLGYLAQERRSARLALLLIGCEGFAALVFIFDAKQSPAIVDRLTNVLSFFVALWVMVVAWRLGRAKGGRIVHTRPHHH